MKDGDAVYYKTRKGWFKGIIVRTNTLNESHYWYTVENENGVWIDERSEQLLFRITEEQIDDMVKL